MSDYNASDLRHIRAAKKLSSAQLERNARVIARLMSDPETRAYFHDLLVRASVFSTPFTGLSATTDFNCGRQSLALELFGEIVTYAPDQYIMMMREANDKESVDGRRFGSNTRPSDGRVGDSAHSGREPSATIDHDYDPAANLDDDSTGREQEPEVKKGETLLTAKDPDAKPEEKKEEAKKPEGAPEKYADYKLPEGMTLDAETKTKVDALFKGLNLNQDQAQTLVDFRASEMKVAQEATAKAFKETVDGWAQESMDHPDLKGKLGIGKEITVRISKALDSIPIPGLASEFRQAMNDTGVGNLAPFIRVIDYLSSKVTEGSHVAGNGPSKFGQSKPGDAAQPSAAQAMYPSLPSQQR